MFRQTILSKQFGETYNILWNVSSLDFKCFYISENVSICLVTDTLHKIENSKNVIGSILVVTTWTVSHLSIYDSPAVTDVRRDAVFIVDFIARKALSEHSTCLCDATKQYWGYIRLRQGWQFIKG